MQIKMDTDAVRAMASSMRQSADQFDTKLASIKSAVNSAGWQSQAREEYVMHLEMLTRSTNQSTTVLRMMAQAADRKAEQWETISRIFNGPFHYLTGLWNSVLAFFNRIGSGLMNAITNIHLPTLPKFVFPTISGAAIVGGITSIIPEWDWNPPSWWPFNKQGNNEHNAGGGGGGGGGGSWGESEEANAAGSDQGANSPGSSSSQPVEGKPYPQPPTSPKLEEANRKESSYTCATYAADRRPDLGSTQSNNEWFEDQAAANYISKFEDKSFQLDGSEENLDQVIGKGYALVWEPDPNPDPSKRISDGTYGHVAIIEEVYTDHVVISEASRVNGVYQIRTRNISIDQLNNDLVWLIP